MFLDSLIHKDNSVYKLNKCLLKKQIISHPLTGTNDLIIKQKGRTRHELSCQSIHNIPRYNNRWNYEIDYYQNRFSKTRTKSTKYIQFSSLIISYNIIYNYNKYKQCITVYYYVLEFCDFFCVLEHFRRCFLAKHLKIMQIWS